MPHVHVPHDEDHRASSEPVSEARAAEEQGAPRKVESTHRHGPAWPLKIGLEVVLITVGVFLALMGEQWRESAHTRELTQVSLRGFREEILANRAAVSAVRDYHVTLLKSLQAYLAADPKTKRADSVQINGLQPVFFERTSWDLALATQSLVHLDPKVAFNLSRLYGLQQTYSEATRGIMQAIYLRPLTENADGLVAYYGDLVLWEPQLLRMYDEILPQLDRELGEASGPKPSN